MHPDLAAQAANDYRAEAERTAREERLVRQVKKETREAARARDRASRAERRRSGPSDHDLAV